MQHTTSNGCYSRPQFRWRCSGEIVASDKAVPDWASGLSLRHAADLEHAIHYQTKRVYRLVDDELRKMTVPGLGSLKYLTFDGRHALSLERSRTRAFDVSVPASPTTVESQNHQEEQLYQVAPVLYPSVAPQQIHFGFGDEQTADQIELLTTTFNSLTVRRRALDADLDEQSTTFRVFGLGGELAVPARPDPRGSLSAPS